MRDTRIAREMFGHAELGDWRREERLVVMTARALQAPAGTVTSVISDAAEREGAYRFLESCRITSSQLMLALARSTAEAASRESFVFVALDGSSLTLRDPKRCRDIGAVGAYSHHGRGLIVLSALAATAEGTPIGLCGQRWWSREPDAVGAKHELRHSTELIDEVIEVMRERAPSTKIWFQLDRLYDSQLVLEHLDGRDAWFTVRASQPRRLHVPKGAPRKYTDHEILKQRIWGRHEIEITDSNGKRRTAKLDVRVLETVISARRKSKTRCKLGLHFVDVRERKGGLRWTLMTNRPVETLADAIEVINGYSTRWRVEEFHRAWKNGACHVEDTQLRSREAIIKWATILAAVATRATRLAYLAREKPDLPATTEFSLNEITVAVTLAKKRAEDFADVSLGTFVELVARLGGYTGKSSGGPPGPTTIARGLRRVIDIAPFLDELTEAAVALRKK
jgi:hypothetical protein